MNKKLFTLIYLLLSLTIIAQVDRSVMPEPGPAPEIQIGEYESFTLENGLKVFVVENHKLPRVAFSLSLDYDPFLQGEDAGFVRTAGDLLGTATTTKNKDEIDEAIDFIGASFSTSSNGIYAASLKKHTEKLLEIISDVLLNPVFKQDELDKIKKQSISGLQAQKDNPTSIASNVRQVLNFSKNHPYGEVVTEETIENITLDECENFYKTYFRPNIAYLVVVGDIDKSEAEDLVTEYFSKWEKAEVPKAEHKNPKAPLVRKVALVDRPASVQSVINVTYPVDLKIGSDDAIKVEILNQIFGGGSASRLFQNLREDKGFTYGAYSRFASDELVGSFNASCEARNEVTDSAVTEILAEMKKIREELVTEEELNAAKAYLSGSFARSLENPQTVANFALNIERYGLPKDYYKNYLKNLNAVTAEDILETAKKYVRPNNSYVLVVSNGEEVAENLKKFTLSGKIDYYDMYGEKYDPAAKAIPEGVTAQTVLDAYINALGGKEKLQQVEDRQTVMKGTVQGLSLSIKTSQKKPNKFHFDLDAGVMRQIQVFDGEKGKVSAMGQDTPLEGDDLENMKIEARMFEYLVYDEMGVTTELTGMEQVNGKDTYRMLVTYPTGKKTTKYFEIDSGLLVKETSVITTPQGTFNQVIELGDYKVVDGVKYPYTVKQSFGPQLVELTVESITVNQGLDDSLFEVK